MGAGASAQQVEQQFGQRPTVEALRKRGGACFIKSELAHESTADTIDIARVMKAVEAQGLAERGAVLWKNLLHFFEVRQALDAAWAKVEGTQCIEDGIGAFDRLKNDDGKTYNGEYRQFSPATGRPAQNVEELFAAATIARTIYSQVLAKAGSEAKIAADLVVIAPMKERERAQEKARDDYSDRTPGPAEAWLFDVVRGKIVCVTGDEVLAVWHALQAMSHVDVVRVKNRCKEPKFNGYRDFLINLRVRIDGDNDNAKSDEVRLPRATESDAVAAAESEGPSQTNVRAVWHMCELQLHIKQIVDVEKELHSHVAYEFFRNYFHGNEDAVKKRLAVLLEFGEAAKSPEKMVNTVLASKTADIASLQAVLRLMKMMSKLELRDQLLRAILDRVEAKHGEASPEYAKRLGELAGLQKERGHLDEAEKSYRKSLKILQEIQSGEVADEATADEDVADALANLALVLKMQDRPDKYDESKLLSQQYVDIMEDLFGEESENKRPEKLAPCYEDRGDLLNKTGQLGEAMSLFKKALKINEEAFGEKHLSVSVSKTKIGTLLQDQKKYAEAEKCFRDSLDIKRKVFGEEHQNTALGCNNLALCLKKMGGDKLTEAKQLYEQSLAIRIQVFGEDHIEVARSYNNLASLNQSQGNYKEAMEFYQKSLEIKTKVYKMTWQPTGGGFTRADAQHSELAISHRNIGVLCCKLGKEKGKIDEALQHFQKEVEIWKAVENWKEAAKGLNNIARILKMQKKNDDATTCGLEALAIAEKELGADHELTQKFRKVWGVSS